MGQATGTSPLTFVFLDGWTVHTGRVRGMVDRMLSHGFTVLDAQYKALSEADAEEIYRPNLPIREGNSWHVARLIYPMGRSLGLLLTAGPDRCACELMRALKGKASPAMQRAGQLRHDFLAPNKVLSLMHSSDDLAHVFREGQVFFGRQRIEAALAQGGRPQRSEAIPVVASGCHAVGAERIVEPGLGVLFARVRLRIVEQLLEQLASTSEAAMALQAYADVWIALANREERVPVMDEVREYLTLVEREREPVRRLLCSRRQSPRQDRFAEFYRDGWREQDRLEQCIEVLSKPELYERWDSERQMPTELLYDRWERLLFRANLFNFGDLVPSIERERP